MTAKPQSALAKQRNIPSLRWDLLPHQPYCAPSDYHLFRSMQHWLTGNIFQDRSQIGDSLTIYFSSKIEHFFYHEIEDAFEKFIHLFCIDETFTLYMIRLHLKRSVIYSI